MISGGLFVPPPGQSFGSQPFSGLPTVSLLMRRLAQASEMGAVPG
jgi:hypothetical protein